MSDQALAATMHPSYTPKDLWIADSGVSHHMTPHLCHLQATAPYAPTDTITIGNEAGLNIAHIGSFTLSALPGNLHLNQMYHVPAPAANFLSIYQLCIDNNCCVIFDEHHIYV